eukprot:6241068-Prymnesium_polylepis.1
MGPSPSTTGAAAWWRAQILSETTIERTLSTCARGLADSSASRGDCLDALTSGMEPTVKRVCAALESVTSTRVLHDGCVVLAALAAGNAKSRALLLAAGGVRALLGLMGSGATDPPPACDLGYDDLMPWFVDGVEGSTKATERRVHRIDGPGTAAFGTRPGSARTRLDDLLRRGNDGGWHVAPASRPRTAPQARDDASRQAQVAAMQAQLG